MLSLNKRLIETTVEMFDLIGQDLVRGMTSGLSFSLLGFDFQVDSKDNFKNYIVKVCSPDLRLNSSYAWAFFP